MEVVLMNKKGISMLILDVVIALLLIVVIFSFTLPVKWQNQDLTAVNNTEKALSTLQVAIDIYQTRFDGQLPGGIDIFSTDPAALKKEGLQALTALIADIKKENVLSFDDKTNPDEFVNYFADVPGTYFRWDAEKRTYEIVVFSKDRKPFKFVCTNEKITSSDPQKELISYLGEVQGFEGDINENSGKIQNYKDQIADQIPKTLEELSKVDMTPLTMLFDKAKTVQKSSDIDQKELDAAKEAFKKFGSKVEIIKTMPANVKESIDLIGGIVFKAETKMGEIKVIGDSLIDKRLKKSSEKVYSEMKRIMDLADTAYAKMAPVQQEILTIIAQKQAELSVFEIKQVEYKTQLAFITSKITELQKKENDEELAKEEKEEKSKKDK